MKISIDKDGQAFITLRVNPKAVSFIESRAYQIGYRVWDKDDAVWASFMAPRATDPDFTIDKDGITIWFVVDFGLDGTKVPSELPLDDRLKVASLVRSLLL